MYQYNTYTRVASVNTLVTHQQIFQLASSDIHITQPPPNNYIESIEGLRGVKDRIYIKIIPKNNISCP